MRPLLLTLLFALGCSGSQQPAATPATPTTPPADAAPTFEPMAGAATLPDLAAKLEPGGCDDWQGNKIPGARGYFWGEYSIEGGKVTGVERWYLFGNPTWKEKANVENCVIEWNVTGDVAAKGACGDCNASFKGLGIVNQSATTCPEGLWKKENNANYGYDIKRNADGTATWYFSKSGKRLADGYHSSNKLNFVSDAKCNWF